MPYEVTIPALPQALPQQRIKFVVDMPTPSDGFRLSLGSAAGIAKRRPHNADFLCQLEWAWSPLSGRIENFYLSRGRKFWALWCSSYDDNFDKWDSSVQAHCDKCISFSDAAMLMMSAYLSHDRDAFQLEKYHWIGRTGLLDVSEIDAVARAVWPSEGGSK